jgi:signal transduction histidine kinase
MKKPTEPRINPQGRRGGEVAALLAAAHAVLENRAFADAAQAVLEACSTILGAEAGFVALYAANATGFEITALDPGGLALDPAGALPAPLRRLSARASSGRTVFSNHLSRRRAKAPLAGRGSVLQSALLAPMIIGDEVPGFLGLLNKPGGFSAADSKLAEVFAEMAAVSMLESRTRNGLERNRHALEKEVREGATQLRQAEVTFRTLVENLPDVVARFDPDLRHLYVSPAVESIADRPSRDYVGKTNRELGLPKELIERWDAALRRAFATGQRETLEIALPAPEGIRHFDCRIVPERGAGDEIASVLTVARDVTDRWLAHEAEQRARTIADTLREATMALTRSLDRETVLVTLLDRLRRIVPFDRAAVMLVEEATRVSVRAVFDGDHFFPLTAEVRSAFDPTDHPIVETILTTGTAVLIPDVHTHPDWRFPTDSSAEASWMGVPLFARGDVAGLFSLSKREASYFSQEHVKLAEAMSSQASVAIENAVLFEQMQAATLRMKALSRRLVETQESERRHIARELHDAAGQTLVSLRYGLRLLEREIAEGKSTNARVAELVEQTDAVIDGLHRLAADLRPASLDHLGLEATLRQYLRSTGSKFGLMVRFKARGLTNERLPAAVEIGLYRVVQEAMTNVVRHAQATRVDVLAEREGERVLVMVEDDGVGFDPEQIRRWEQLGLLGLQERAEALGGTLTLESAAGAGATVVVEVPIVDSHPDR